MLANIEKERIRKRLSQEQIALQLGVSHKTYYNWINERKDITSKKLQKLSQMFGSSMEYLLGASRKEFFIFVMEMFQPARKIHATRIQKKRAPVHHVIIQKM